MIEQYTGSVSIGLSKVNNVNDNYYWNGSYLYQSVDSCHHECKSLDEEHYFDVKFDHDTVHVTIYKGSVDVVQQMVSQYFEQCDCNINWN